MSESDGPVRLLFVCLGNICRSPTAEGVMRHVVAEQGLGDRIDVDSAGTGSWHVGHPPDERATEAAARRGIVLEGTARRFTSADFDHYDLLLAADRDNLSVMRGLAPDEAARDRVHLLREFDPEAVAAGELEVPDPYYGGPDGFEDVLDGVERACRGLLEHLRLEGRLA